MKPYLIILLAVCGFAGLHPSVVRAQNGTSLPTSMYGIGELAAGDGGRYAGMGNVGIGVSRAGFLNTFNPAALTRMDSACFTFDVGVTAYYARYAFQNERSSSMEGGPNRFSFGFRLLPRWYMVVGVSPYSSVGYLIQTQEEIEGMPGASLTSVFRGEGGLYRAYVSQAFVLTPALYAGVCIGMLTGKVTQSETQEGATVSDESAKRSTPTSACTTSAGVTGWGWSMRLPSASGMTTATRMRTPPLPTRLRTRAVPPAPNTCLCA